MKKILNRLKDFWMDKTEKIKWNKYRKSQKKYGRLEKIAWKKSI